MRESIELTSRQTRTILLLSVPAIVLVVVTAAAGIAIPGTYFRETVNWTLQSMGQDLVNFFIAVPLLALSIILVVRKIKIGFLLWGGINLYLIYTYIIYSFDIHFNRLFLAYCSVLGLSFYSFIYFIYLSIQQKIVYQPLSKNVSRVTAGYLLIIAYMFFFLWLSKIIPSALLHTVPDELMDTGLATNPVHVLDLSVFLPALFITSLLLSAKNELGYLLAPVMLIFSALMSITVATLIWVMKFSGVETSNTVIVVMCVLIVMGLLLFKQYTKNPATAIK